MQLFTVLFCGPGNREDYRLFGTWDNLKSAFEEIQDISPTLYVDFGQRGMEDFDISNLNDHVRTLAVHKKIKLVEVDNLSRECGYYVINQHQINVPNMGAV